MNNIDINKLKIKNDFLVLENNKTEIIFSTANNNRSFNRNTKDGIEALDSIREEFNVLNVAYLKQIHSDKVLTYNGEDNFNENEGDAIITNRKNVAIGVFTADCVPVIIINEKSNVIAAIHSGWKGTFNSITKKTLEKMKEEYNVDHKFTKIYIGAHIRGCCYEISEELKDEFIKKKANILEKELFEGRKLNLQRCIYEDVLECGVKEENINSLDLCTYCEKDIKLYSYRKSEGSYGRLFTFVILR